MEKATQLSIAMGNVPGQLGRLCRVLAQAGVNVRGISISDAADLSVVRLLASDPAAAENALREAGIWFTAHDVLVVELDHRPGALEGVAMRLGEAGINVHYVYGAADGAEGKAVLVLSVSDVDLARQTLGE
ncbi:MAG TPA: ACT domain-containing protein [Phycisphaerae bacterium]|nr:ACT domain-containing protein [Phycisphaerae bacterium]